MTREVHRLNALTVKNLTKPGRHADGNGLYLNVSKSGAKSWVLLYKRHGRRREMGLGSARLVPLSAARQRAIEAQQSMATGVDPLDSKITESPKTFGECADAFITSMETSWRNDKHRAQWRMTLTEYARPLRDIPVSNIDTLSVLRVLKPIWAEKPETAYRLMGRIERVLSAAKAQGLRSGENPAQWRGHLENLLPARKKLGRGHHRALPFVEVPDFMKRLKERSGMAAIALEFTILTAARSGEVRGATLDEINFEDALWEIPAERMKAGRSHRVPLCPRAMDLIEQARSISSDVYLFPGPKPGKMLSENGMSALLKRMQVNVTVHGFRSSFRDWAAETTDFANEVCEMALAHAVRNQTERAYRRGDLLVKRRELMNLWSIFCQGKEF